ncbi:hemagglutinin repeat-containing protein [[Pasteurella] aerogenes]|nr:hemagglutinin repeat-containing protein [[Pasteurella] aerogenes]
MIKILQILAVNLPLVFDTSGVSLARPLMRIALNEQQEVRSIQPNLVIPQNVLYRVNANPTNRVLVETDPDFTNQKRWLSSDYMFNALRYEPNQTQKRLGDGFYEQRLVREQINRLTGRNFVGDYTDFDSQYRGLMDAGVTFAQKFNLRPGIALSPSQVAQLTTDIGTDLAALNGNLTVIAGGNLTANAVNLESGKDLHLQGKNVTLNAAVETQDSQHSSYAKSAGMGISITYNPVATFKQAYGEQSGQGSAGSIVGKAITAGEALDKTSHKIMQSVSPYWSAKSSKSSTNQHQETAVVSQLNAGGNLSITATEGDITTQGALLSAKGDGNLWAKEEVTLGVATSRSAQDSHSSRKGVDIELSRRPTDVVGLYSGKDLGDGESETQHANILSFGGNSNITAEKGNITLVGTQLVSEGDNRLTAGENIRIRL